MAVGVIYITTTSVTGLIKTGKTRSDQFENRMNILEQNGYWNVNGLKRYFAVEVEDYDEKEKLLHTVFSKSQVANSELFALDKDLAMEMLEAFDGKQIYPVPEKSENFPINTHKRNPNFSFEMLEIPIGSDLTYVSDESKHCAVKNGENIVEYNGKEYTLTALAQELKGKKPLQGPAYFKYSGELLINIRKRKERN